jgi:hypothetical protein
MPKPIALCHDRTINLRSLNSWLVLPSRSLPNSTLTQFSRILARCFSMSRFRGTRTCGCLRFHRDRIGAMMSCGLRPRTIDRASPIPAVVSASPRWQDGQGIWSLNGSFVRDWGDRDLIEIIPTQSPQPSTHHSISHSDSPPNPRSHT